MRIIRNLFVALWAAALVACNCQSFKSQEQETPSRGVYYWKTTFSLNEEEIAFLKTHEISDLYIRYFDVVRCGSESGFSYCAIPNATIKFPPKEKLDSIFTANDLHLRVIPTVYITCDALSSIRLCGRVNEMCDKIFKRIDAMNKHYGLSDCVDEIQLDCDWTEYYRDTYFSICKAFMTHRHSTGIKTISSTIRLHQLKGTPPPVNCGVLMLYNTGDFRDWGADNSILTYKDVSKYLKQSSTYRLPLKAAYPNYSWTVYYDDNEQFCCLSTSGTKKTGKYRYETSKYSEIINVKKLVESSNLNITGNIIYHLDSKNIKKYTDEEISNIYR